MPPHKPLQGLTFCCTGLSHTAREAVTTKTEALGGVVHPDLMSDVVYLIVGERFSAKYSYSVKNRHDVFLVDAEAVLRIYDHWIGGDDEKLDIAQYELPLFKNISVCMLRLEVPNDHAQLLGEAFRKRASAEALPACDLFNGEKLLAFMEAHGAKVLDSLLQSTDLVISTECSGKRYTKAVEWHVPVVHPIWVFDSFLRLAALQPDDYALREERTEYNEGCNVWNQFFSRKRPLARGDEESGEISKRSRLRTNTKVWQSIMSEKTAFLGAKSSASDIWEEQNDEDEALVETSVPSRTVEPVKSALFQGLKFLVVGFTEKENGLLSLVIESHTGETGRLNTSEDETITHVIIPVQKSVQSTAMLRMLSLQIKTRINNREIEVVTEWFLERSIFYNRISLDSWGRPIKGLVRAKHPFKVCISGFVGIELLHLEKLISYLNFEYCDTLNANRDLLVININLFKQLLAKSSPELYTYKYKDVVNCPVYQSGTSSVSRISSKNKINAAKKWNIPIVSISYLWEMTVLSRTSTTKYLALPDLLNLQWCLFAPESRAKGHKFLDYVRSLSGENFETQMLEEPEDKIQLPSPRKSSREKVSYGRLVGKGESLTDKLREAEKSEEEQEADVTREEDGATQVGYENTDSMKEQEELFKKLEKPRRRRN